MKNTRRLILAVLLMLVVGWHDAAESSRGIGWRGSIRTATSSTRQSRNCAVDPQVWAQEMTMQLPRFANLELARQQASFRVVLVGIPEVENLAIAEAEALQAIPKQEDLFAVYFTTLERQLVIEPDSPTPPPLSFDQRRTEEVQLAYRAIIARPLERMDAPWQLIRLDLMGSATPIRTISDGAIAQGIRNWQQAGCPSPADLELSSSRTP
jgi:hypothetical protein